MPSGIPGVVNLPPPRIIVNVTPKSIWQRIADVLLKIVCFWKWFTPSKPLTDRQITVIKDFKPEIELAKPSFDERFKSLLTRKIEVLVDCVHEKFLKKSVDETTKATEELPEVIESIFRLAETAEGLAGTHAPLDDKIKDPKLINDSKPLDILLVNLIKTLTEVIGIPSQLENEILSLIKASQPLNDLLSKLTKDVDPDSLQNKIAVKIKELSSHQESLKNHLPLMIQWLMKTDRSVPLHTYLNLESEADSAFLLNISLKMLFEIQKAELLKKKIKATIEGSDIEINQYLPCAIEWLLGTNRELSLQTYMATRGFKDPTSNHVIFQMMVRNLFAIKREEFPRKLASALKNAPTLVKDTLKKESETLGTKAIDKLRKLLTTMEAGFPKTFDEEMQHIIHHFTLQLDPKADNPLLVGNVEAYVKEKEQEYYKKLAETTLKAIAPELYEAPTQPLHNAVAPLVELQKLYNEALEISEELLPSAFTKAIKGYAEGPQSIVFNAEQPYIRLQLEKGLVKTFESIRDMLTQESQRDALLTDTVLPSLEEQVKTVYIRQVLQMNSKEMALALGNCLNGGDIEKLQHTLYQLVTKSAVQNKWEEEEFKKLSKPILDEMRELILKTQEEQGDKPLSLEQVDSIIKQHALRDSDIPVDVEKDGPLYAELVKTVVFKVGEFGKWNEWLYGFKSVQNKVAKAILSSIHTFRSSPQGILESALEGVDRTLTRDKFFDLLDDSLEDLQKSQQNIIAEIAETGRKLDDADKKIQENSSKIEELKNPNSDRRKQLDQTVDIQRKQEDLLIKNRSFRIAIQEHQAHIANNLLPRLTQVEASIAKITAKQESEVAENASRKIKRPQIVQTISKTVFDIFQINAGNVAGPLGRAVARKVTGSDAKPIADLIHKVSQRFFNSDLPFTLNKVFATFVKAIIGNGNAVPSAVNPKSIRDTVVEAPAPVVGQLTFPRRAETEERSFEQQLKEHKKAETLPVYLQEYIAELVGLKDSDEDYLNKLKKEFTKGSRFEEKLTALALSLNFPIRSLEKYVNSVNKWFFFEHKYDLMPNVAAGDDIKVQDKVIDLFIENLIEERKTYLALNAESLSDPTQGLGTFIRTLSHQAFKIVHKKFIKPAFQGVKEPVGTAGSLINQYTSLLVDFVNENQSGISDSNHSVNILRVKLLTSGNPIPTDLEATLKALGFDDDRKHAALVLNNIQNDPSVKAKLSTLTYSSTKTLENYTHPILSWILNIYDNAENYSTFPNLPDLDPALVKAIFGIYVDYLANARLQYLVNIAKNQLQGELENSLTQLIPEKMDIVLNVVTERLSVLFSQMNNGSYSHTLDQLLHTVNETISLVIEINNTHDKKKDEYTRQGKDSKSVITREVLDKHLKDLHETTQEIFNTPKTIDPATILDTYYEKMASTLLSILFPQGIEILAKEIGISNEIVTRIGYYHQLVEPFLTPERDGHLRAIKEQLTNEIKGLIHNITKSLMKKSLKGGIKLGLDKLRPQEFSILLAETILPSIKNTVQEKHFTMIAEAYLKANEATVLAYLKDNHVESRKVRKDAIFDTLFVSFEKTCVESKMSRTTFDTIANSYFTQMTQFIVDEIPTPSARPNKEEEYISLLSSTSQAALHNALHKFCLPPIDYRTLTTHIQNILKNNTSVFSALFHPLITKKKPGEAKKELLNKLYSFFLKVNIKNKCSQSEFMRVAETIIDNFVRNLKTYNAKILPEEITQRLGKYLLTLNNIQVEECPLGPLSQNILSLTNFGFIANQLASAFSGTIQQTLFSLIEDFRKSPDILLRKITEGLKETLGSPESLRAIMLEETDLVGLKKQKEILQTKIDRLNQNAELIQDSQLKLARLKEKMQLIDINLTKTEKKNKTQEERAAQGHKKTSIACKELAQILYDFIMLSSDGKTIGWVFSIQNRLKEILGKDSTHLNQSLEKLIQDVFLNPQPIIGENIALNAGTHVLELLENASKAAQSTPSNGSPVKRVGSAASAAVATAQ